jgi:hypothetical protein
MSPPTTPGQRVLHYALTHLRHKVGRGECWDLPYYALRHAGASTPQDLGSDLYVWGQRIANLADAQPGDILQFEGVRVRYQWTSGDTVHWQTYNFQTRHSAIVERVDSGMFFTILNAHVNHNKRVSRLHINLSPENITSGTIYLYRPIARSSH